MCIFGGGEIFIIFRFDLSNSNGNLIKSELQKHKFLRFGVDAVGDWIALFSAISKSWIS